MVGTTSQYERPLFRREAEARRIGMRPVLPELRIAPKF